MNSTENTRPDSTSRNQRHVNKNVQNKKNNKKPVLLAIGGVVLVALIAVFAYVLVRFTPSRERMDLTDYYYVTSETSAAVVLNGDYELQTEPQGQIVDGQAYVSLDFMKSNIDDRYVYDSVENTLRYVTDSQVISAYLQSKDYLIDREQNSANADVLILQDDTVYILLDFAINYSDFTYYTAEEPNRIIMETAGWEHQTATVKRDGEYRRFGGIKSQIVDDATKGETVIVLEDYGDWSLVLNERGVRGCIENKRLKTGETVTTEARLEERTYNHLTYNNGKIRLGWHQVTTAAANDNLASVLSNANGLNVISPTWLGLSDNAGNISDLSDSSYVATCHAAGIQVWALVSNFVNSDVDTTTVLNTTSSRDALVNNIIASAITSNVDGINVDFESLSTDAKDGYIEFIRELSLKCEKNDLILSVDNYKPTEYTAFYQRDEQANYADYIILMAYDEHYAGSEEAGSVSSISFVREGVEDTLKEVPAEQLILALPFYTRVWTTASDGTVTSDARGMEAAQEFIDRNEVEMTWLDDVGQYYGEFTTDEGLYQIWMEETESLSLKMQEITDNNLAGGAFWKLGFEPSSIWDTIIRYIN